MAVPLQTPKNIQSSPPIHSQGNGGKIFTCSSSTKPMPFPVLYRSTREERESEEPSPSFSIPPPLLLHYLFSSFFPSISSSIPCKPVCIPFRAFLFLSSSFFPFLCFLFSGSGNMTKKKIRFCVDPDPSSSFLAGEEAMARFKHQYLFHDYQELLKETKDKRERLQKETQKKLKLLAEVKFLRKKYEFLTKTKKQSHKIRSPSKQIIRTPPDLALKERNFKSSEAFVPTPRKLIDLNQVSLPNDEETDPFMNMEKLRGFEASSMADDVKLSVCREIGSSSNRLGKRRVSWQDQPALRV